MVYMDENGWLGAKGQYYTSATDAQESFMEAFKWAKPSPPEFPREHSEQLQVFLCHAKEDKDQVRTLYDRLINSQINPWLDEKNILPGQRWKTEITKAISQSDAILVCLSHTAITKSGYIHKEIREALERADEQPIGRIFIIPLRFEDCEVPERFRDIQWVDYFDPNGYNRLILAFQELTTMLNSANRSVLMPRLT